MLKPLLVSIAILLAAPASQCRAEDGKASTLSGAWQGSLVIVRWRDANRTAYAPETVVYLENRGDEPLSVWTDWKVRVCGDNDAALAEPAPSFVDDLFGDLVPLHTLGSRQWDAISFPRGLPPAPGSPPPESCRTRITIRVRKQGAEDRLELDLPMHMPPVRGRGR